MLTTTLRLLVVLYCTGPTQQLLARLHALPAVSARFALPPLQHLPLTSPCWLPVCRLATVPCAPPPTCPHPALSGYCGGHTARWPYQTCRTLAPCVVHCPAQCALQARTKQHDTARKQQHKVQVCRLKTTQARVTLNAFLLGCCSGVIHNCCTISHTAVCIMTGGQKHEQLHMQRSTAATCRQQHCTHYVPRLQCQSKPAEYYPATLSVCNRVDAWLEALLSSTAKATACYLNTTPLLCPSGQQLCPAQTSRHQARAAS